MQHFLSPGTLKPPFTDTDGATTSTAGTVSIASALNITKEYLSLSTQPQETLLLMEIDRIAHQIDSLMSALHQVLIDHNAADFTKRSIDSAPSPLTASIAPVLGQIIQDRRHTSQNIEKEISKCFEMLIAHKNKLKQQIEFNRAVLSEVSAMFQQVGDGEKERPEKGGNLQKRASLIRLQESLLSNLENVCDC